MELTKPLIIAHRGSAGEAPENTMAAFKLALEQQCDAIELDVHLSKDGKIIVCHDATVDRTTNGKGHIHEMTVDQIKALDAGSWFDAKYAGEQIPLLEEVFDLVPPHIMINVEVKYPYGHEIEAKLIQLMREKNRVDNVVVSSFDFKSLLVLKGLEPEVKIGLLYNVNFVRHRDAAVIMQVPVYSLHPNMKRISKEDVADAKSHGLHVYPYTINTEKDMRKAINCKVSGIITDYPAVLRKVLEEEKQLQ
ncbi:MULTISPECIES: glycerophosphodiester phosphodiesterase [unclassified Paenibacillus]|uniref:glycerophosphodiester phosphodiesterase n=1 Tax=unclassified Paenibacillus TaxID=185978 RepID=UPI002F420D7B